MVSVTGALLPPEPPLPELLPHPAASSAAAAAAAAIFHRLTGLSLLMRTALMNGPLLVPRRLGAPPSAPGESPGRIPRGPGGRASHTGPASRAGACSAPEPTRPAGALARPG